MLAGYSLFGPDDDNYMIDEQSVLELCARCGFLKKFNYHNPSYRVKRKVYDFFHPYDLGTIVSQKFKEFCLRENYKDVEFKELERSFGYYQLFVTRTVQFDSGRTGTEFLNLCPVCHNYEEATGVTPPYLLGIQKELEDGFYRTDIIFGSRNSKSPLTIIGPETQQKLKREKMKGVVYIPINL